MHWNVQFYYIGYTLASSDFVCAITDLVVALYFSCYCPESLHELFTTVILVGHAAWTNWKLGDLS